MAGGNLDKPGAVIPAEGVWYYEPKFNGHRALVHVPSRTMFNRHGKPLSIQREFAAALELLAAKSWTEWLDCEVLARRADLAKGTIVVLDEVAPGCYEDRHAQIAEYFNYAPFDPRQWRENSVYLTRTFKGLETGRSLWAALKDQNTWGADSSKWFYEGVVAKRADSPYPIQLQSDEKEFSGWLKYRWRW